MSTRFRSTELSPIPRLLGWLGLILMCCFTNAVFAGQVTLAWDPSSSSDVGGYKVVYGQSSGAYTSEVDVGKQTSNTVANLDDSKTYYFAVRAYNTDKTVESANSNEVSKSASATTSPSSATLPSPWIDMDIGNVGQAGSASYASGAFTLNGSGDDIWSVADAFHFAYQPLNGDGSIMTRVTSIANTNSWAKAGVMIRESLDANARHAMVAVTAGNGVAFQRRTTTGGSSVHTAGAVISAPYWVKLTRTGNAFTAYQSVDGTNWVQIGSATISMATSVYVGLAMTSHNNSVLNTSVLDNVNVQTGNTSPATVQYTFNSQPSGLNLTYDGASRATPFTVDTEVGTQHTISAPASQSNYNFSTWSDGGAATHAITIGASPQTITANYVVATPAPTADFSADQTSGPAQLKVQFTDKSTNATAWSWNFGDDTNTTSSDQHPSHTYTKAGTYTVTLTASNTTGSNVQTKTGYIKVTEPEPVANFSVSSTTGTTATVFNFFDSSTGTPTSWSWSFQHNTDSSTSFTRADQNPMVTFPKAGTYTVTLTVSPGNSTATKQISVTEAAPLADFGVNLTDGSISTPFKFTDNSKGTVETWSWKFINSTDSTATISTSNIQNPEKIFSKPGTYTVSLTVTGPGGSDIVTKTNYISVSNSLLSQDIGNVGSEGSASFTNGTYTLQGSGADIWSTSDSFHFAYQQLDGDCTIVARVTSITNTNSWAKAGVMIRESLDANSKHAMVLLRPGGGTGFARRTTTGGHSSWTKGTATTFPHWVKLVRAGNRFTAYQSANGSTWIQIGSTSITMATSMYVGLAVTSHDNSVLNTAILDNVSVSK